MKADENRKNDSDCCVEYCYFNFVIDPVAGAFDAAAALILPVAVSVVYLFLPGRFEVQPLDIGTKAAFVTRGIFLAGFGAGVVEEMLFRGLCMNVALEGGSIWNSAIVHAFWNMIIIGGGMTIGTGQTSMPFAVMCLRRGLSCSPEGNSA